MHIGCGPRGHSGRLFCFNETPIQVKADRRFYCDGARIGQGGFAADFSGSLREGTNALRAALDAVKSGSCRSVLVCAADVRLGHPMGSREMALGDGAAALLIGDRDNMGENRLR